MKRFFLLSAHSIDFSSASFQNDTDKISGVGRKAAEAMRRRKRTEFFKLCGLFSTIIINLISICTQHTASAILLEERMEVVKKVLREVPLIDGLVK